MDDDRVDKAGHENGVDKVCQQLGPACNGATDDCTRRSHGTAGVRSHPVSQREWQGPGLHSCNTPLLVGRKKLKMEVEKLVSLGQCLVTRLRSTIDLHGGGLLVVAVAANVH